MPRPQVNLDPASRELRERFARITADLRVRDGFPAGVCAEAEATAVRPLSLPDRDETAVPFCTIDPPGALDLDQALHIERRGRGYRVRYAVAHLPSFVRPEGAVDAEATRRGETIYLPGGRVPLLPPALSEDAASLLPYRERPAYVWDMHVDSAGEGTSVQVYPAMVRSVDRFDYSQVQEMVDRGTRDHRILLLKEVGLLRIAREAARGGASLPLPSQQVSLRADGHYYVHFRPPLPAEDWNAQLSLLTGMAAARLMLRARIGLLRTMPRASRRSVGKLRRAAHALGVPWTREMSYGTFLRGLDRTDPRHLALIHEAAALFRGAGYTAFDGCLPARPRHAAVASPYAHVTAPLRRLGDRYCLELCASISAGVRVPDWVRHTLPALPATLGRSAQRAGAIHRACVSAAEAAVLAPFTGQDFAAVIVDDGRGSRLAGHTVEVQLLDHPVIAPAAGIGTAGERVSVVLESADVATSTVRFRIADRAIAGHGAADRAIAARAG